MEASPALEQWHQTAQQLKRGNRPHTNPQLMRRYAGVLEELFTDSAAPLNQVVPDLHLLPSGVVGMAFGATSSQLTPERQHTISTWISNQDQDRGDVERAYALRGLLGSAPQDAFYALCSLRASPTPNKDQRERLASELSGIRADAIARIFSDQEEYEIRKVVLLLLVAAQEAKADRQTRAAILEGVLPVTARLALHRGSIGVELRKHMQAAVGSLDEPSLKRLRESLHEIGPDALRDLLGEPLPTAHPQPESTLNKRSLEPEPTPEPRTSAPGQTTKEPGLHTKPDPLAWFDANIQMLAHAREFYLAARTEANLERQRREEAESRASEHSSLAAKLSGAEAQIRDLKHQLGEASRIRDSRAEELRAVMQKLEAEQEMSQTRERELLEAKEAFSRERDGLQRRIDTNAEARVRDFRGAIRAAIAPLLRDVPPPGSERAAELGPNLLVCIDQIIRTLSDNGIELRRVAGERP